MQKKDFSSFIPLSSKKGICEFFFRPTLFSRPFKLSLHFSAFLFKIACILVSITVLSACSFGTFTESIQPAAPPAEAFQGRAQLLYREKEISCIVSRTIEKKTSITVRSPQEVEGLSFVWDGDAFYMEYAGLSVSSEECPLPRNAFAPILQDMIETIIRAETLQKTENGEYEAFWNTTRLQVQLDHDTGRILHLSAPALSLEVSFLYDI